MLQEQIAPAVGPARIDIAYERHGNPANPAVLLIMGLGGQLVHWPRGFLDALVSRALCTICFDNRDAGHSTHFGNGSKPDLVAALGGDLSSASYTLSDMAADAAGLLDFLGIGAAHVVGASMGGAIGQVMAIEHADRVRSLTSMMSSTGNMSVGQIHHDTQQAIFGVPPATAREQAVERAIRIAPIIRSPAYPTAPGEIAKIAALAWDRDHDIMALSRQAVANLASGDRTDKLRSLAIPTLVIHGSHDTICDVSGGHATAAAIPGAQFVLIQGMGHDIPPGLWDCFADHIALTVRRGEAH